MQVLTGYRERWMVLVSTCQHGISLLSCRLVDFVAALTSLDHASGPSLLLVGARVGRAMHSGWKLDWRHFRKGSVPRPLCDACEPLGRPADAYGRDCHVTHVPTLVDY